jgi:DNA mismatch endonuclease (patch repair protein)
MGWHVQVSCVCSKRVRADRCRLPSCMMGSLQANRKLIRSRQGRLLVVPSFTTFRSTSPTASLVMRSNTKDGGVAERLLRTAVRKGGVRPTVQPREILGRPDLVFRRARVCVFCDGDFWHGRNWNRLRSALERRANATYWTAKIARNRQRDRSQRARLRNAGWTVLSFWESDVLVDPEAAATAVIRTVRAHY